MYQRARSQQQAAPAAARGLPLPGQTLGGRPRVARPA